MGIEKRGIALLRMTELAETATSVERLKAAIRSEGLGYRDTFLHRDASNAFYRVQGEARQAVINLNDTIARNDYLRGDWYRGENYKFFGEATWYNPTTGQYETGLFSMYSNVDLPSDELTDLWSASRGEYEAQTGLMLVGIDWKEKWHKIGSPYRETLEL